MRRRPFQQSIFPILLLLLSTTGLSHGNFLEEPLVKWTYRLPGSGTLSDRGLRTGNEVLVVPNNVNNKSDNDNTVLVTADDGSLHFIFPANLRETLIFAPEPITGTFTECRSGVTPVYNDQDGSLEYVIYAVLDVPVNAGVLYDGVGYDPSRTTTLSRVIAINAADGSLRWSIPINGAVVGKPVVGDNKLYVVHNVPSSTEGGPQTRGKVSVILLRSEPPVVTASLSPLSGNGGPLGPPAATTVTINGKERAVVVVAESWDNGYAENKGNVYMLRPSNLYDEFSGQGNDAYELRVINNSGAWSVASVARPGLRTDATEVFVGGMGARLGGWTGDSSISGVVAGAEAEVQPSWDITLEPNKGNASQPLLVSPILSSDETVLFQVGASTELHCLDTRTGDTLWTEDGALRTAIVAEPRLVELLDEEPKLYVIEGMNGKVRQHDALTGTIDWSFDCQKLSGIACNDAVEAEFSVDPSGNVLYYGDIFGKIVALEIASFTNTAALTTAPTQKPTVAPDVPVAQQDVEEEQETGKDTDEKKTDSPTWAPVETVPVPAHPRTPAPQSDIGFDSSANTDSDTLVEPQDTTIGSSAAMNTGEDDKSSFFANDILIILVAVCGGLAVAIIMLLVASKVRSSKRANGPKSTPVSQDDTKDWNYSQDEYELECRQQEEETLREIVTLASTPPLQTPTKVTPTKRTPKKQKKSSPPAVTPTTLTSIEESPAECEISFVSDTTAKNLDRSFALVEEKVPTKKESVKKAVIMQMELKDDSDGASDNRTSVSVCSSQQADLQSVEVVASDTSGVTKGDVAQHPRRAVSPESITEDYPTAANDLMSVDGSMYLDDDSCLQGRVEVASLSQFSVASSKDGDSELADAEVRYVAATGIDRYLQPPRQATSPLLRPNLSPEVQDYLRRNQSTLSPNPMTSSGYVCETQTTPLSTSPISPLSDTEKSPEESNVGRDVARAGQSVRPGGSLGKTQRPGRTRESPPRDPDESRSRSPPRPPVKSEDEPEDAWNSFLSELAKAEREFFNPSFSKKKKPRPGREQSPPPPPPPDSPPESPVHSPPDPPTDKKKRHL